MPNAAGVRSLGICSVCSRAARTDKTLCPNVDYPPHTHIFLRSLPAKTAALAKTGHGCRLCAAVKPANPPACFPGAAKSPAPCHVCYYWRSYTLVAPPGCNCRIASSAFRYGSGVTGVGDLIRAICCVSRYHAGCTADGIAKPSHEHGPLRPSIFSVPGYANAT